MPPLRPGLRLERREREGIRVVHRSDCTGRGWPRVIFAACFPGIRRLDAENGARRQQTRPRCAFGARTLKEICGIPEATYDQSQSSLCNDGRRLAEDWRLMSKTA